MYVDGDVLDSRIWKNYETNIFFIFLDESFIPLAMMNFGLFKLDAHFFFSHIDGISFIFPWLSETSFFFDDLLSLA